MPVQACRKDKRPGFRWGESGTCYPYRVNDGPSRERARALAERQGRAIESEKKNKQEDDDAEE